MIIIYPSIPLKLEIAAKATSPRVTYNIVKSVEGNVFITLLSKPQVIVQMKRTIFSMENQFTYLSTSIPFRLFATMSYKKSFSLIVYSEGI